MARTVYVTTALTGGGSGLDGIDGANLVKGDVAFYINRDSTSLAGTMGNYHGIYVATTKNASDDAPEIINPDANPGDFNWEKTQPLWSAWHTTGFSSTMPNFGTNIIRTTGANVLTLRRPKRGARKTLVFATTSPIKIRCTTAVAGSLTVPTVRIGTACAKTTGTAWSVIISPTSRALQRIPASIDLIGRSTARWDVISLTEPGTGTVKKNITFSSST